MQPCIEVRESQMESDAILHYCTLDLSKTSKKCHGYAMGSIERFCTLIFHLFSVSLFDFLPYHKEENIQHYLQHYPSHIIFWIKISSFISSQITFFSITTLTSNIIKEITCWVIFHFDPNIFCYTLE